MTYFNFPPKHAKLVGEQPATPEHISVTWLQWFQELRDGLDSGMYIPTLTPVVNVATFLLHEHRFLKIGRTVLVSGSFDYTTTAAAGTNTQLRLTLPVATNFTNFFDVAGNAVSVNGTVTESARIFADFGADTAYFEWLSGSTAARTFFYSFVYDIK